MKRRFFVLDIGLCFGCYGCVAACAAANGTPPVWWRRVLKLPPEDGNSGTRWLSLSCNHCADPPCVKACPSGALIKRDGDGIVLHLEEHCLGCRYCQMACPFDAVRWDAGKGTVSKCHFCYERLDEGREPACVETCFAGALRCIEVESEDEPGCYELEVPGFVRIPGVEPSLLFSDGGRLRSVRRSKPFPPPVPAADTGRNAEKDNGGD